MEIQGKICLITGATSGIGRETAKAMAAGGAVLVLPVRNSMKGDLLKDEILEHSPGATVDMMHCNLASFASVRQFAKEFLAKYDQLHILINNAGIFETKRNLSEDGVEMTFAVNHLAPFLLTHLLLEVMTKSAPGRIINVSSESHKRGGMRFDDLEFEKKYSSLKAYAQSKLANILFTKKLSQQLRDSGLTANCLHPGMVATGIYDRMPGLLTRFLGFFMKSPQEGAQTLIYLATSPEVEGVSGAYFAKNKRFKPKTEAMRQDVANRLWEISNNYVGIR